MSDIPVSASDAASDFVLNGGPELFSDGPETAARSRDWRDTARLGKNGIWRYLLGFLLFIFAVLFVGSTGFVLVALFFLVSRGSIAPGADGVEIMGAIASFAGESSVQSYIANTSIFLWGLAALAVVLPVLHRRSFWTLLGSQQRLRIWRLLSAFGFFFGLLSLVAAIVYVISPQDFIWTFRPWLWFSLLLVTLPLTFLQVACEELFFRGYLLQGLGLLIRRRWLLAGLSAVPFAAAHFMNPEMMRGLGWMALYYYSYGVITSWLTLKDNGLELPLALHLATNYFGILIVSAVDSVLPVPSLFTVQAGGSPPSALAVFWLEIALFYYVFVGRRSRQLAPNRLTSDPKTSSSS